MPATTSPSSVNVPSVYWTATSSPYVSMSQLVVALGPCVCAQQVTLLPAGMHPLPQGMSIKPHLVTVMLSGGGGDEQAMAQARPRKTASDAVLLARIIVDVGMTSPPISPYQDDAERPECPAGILRRRRSCSRV